MDLKFEVIEFPYVRVLNGNGEILADRIILKDGVKFSDYSVYANIVTHKDTLRRITIPEEIPSHCPFKSFIATDTVYVNELRRTVSIPSMLEGKYAQLTYYDVYIYKVNGYYVLKLYDDFEFSKFVYAPRIEFTAV